MCSGKETKPYPQKSAGVLSLTGQTDEKELELKQVKSPAQCTNSNLVLFTSTAVGYMVPHK